MDDYYDPYFWDDPLYLDVPIMLPATPEPKPTLYAKVQFKSRLEARWAVLFDALGLPWEYESVKFKFSPQNWEYTPDFRITLAPLPLSPAEKLRKRPKVPRHPAENPPRQSRIPRSTAPLGPPMLLEVKPAVPEAAYFKAMDLIEKQSKEFQTAIGVGSFYKEYPRIFQTATLSMSLTEWLTSNLGQTAGNANRAMKAASGYRFDLR